MVGKKLITEGDVLAMARGEVLRLDSGTIATPAALDAAYLRGIRVVRGEGGSCSSSSASTGTKQECLWHGMLATDGTYVVQVVDGRATVSRITDQGPVLYGTDSVEEHEG